jgi:hypothetical protein
MKKRGQMGILKELDRLLKLGFGTITTSQILKSVFPQELHLSTLPKD